VTLGDLELNELTIDSAAWSCPDADGVDQLATLIILDPTGAINKNRLRVFWDDPRIEIRGLRIRRIGDEIIIDGDRPVWVKPDVCTLGDDCVEWDDDTNFVENLTQIFVAEEVDRLENAICYEWTTDECGETCATTTQRGCPTIADGELGCIKSLPGAWDGATLTVGSATYCYPPNRYRVRYRAGWANYQARVMDYEGFETGVDWIGSMMADAIVRLTNSLLPDDIRCGCAHAMTRWSQDRMLVGYTQSQGSGGFSRPTIEQSNRCPFGPTYGALHAWRMVRPHVVGLGAYVG